MSNQIKARLENNNPNKSFSVIKLTIKNQNEIVNSLRSLRIFHNLRQKDIDDKIGRRTIANFETNRNSISIDTFIDYCKANGKNGIFAKKRRGGISEAFITMGADYGYRFFPGYKVGVAGGLKTFVDGFMDKWHVHNNIIVPEFKIKHKGTEDIIACYDIIDDGGKREDGTFNSIYHV